MKNNLKPGKDNQEERENFVRFWAEYIRNSKDDKEWSRQQNIIINSQLIKSAKTLKLNKCQNL